MHHTGEWVAVLWWECWRCLMASSQVLCNSSVVIVPKPRCNFPGPQSGLLLWLGECSAPSSGKVWRPVTFSALALFPLLWESKMGRMQVRWVNTHRRSMFSVSGNHLNLILVGMHEIFSVPCRVRRSYHGPFLLSDSKHILVYFLGAPKDSLYLPGSCVNVS